MLDLQVKCETEMKARRERPEPCAAIVDILAESDEPLEPVHLPELRYDLLLDVACGTVHPLWASLSNVVTRACMSLLLPPAPLSGSSLSTDEYDATIPSPARTCEKTSCGN
jgi:hypothetical protein